MNTTLSRKEFDVLEALIESEESLSQRKLAEITGSSAATVNRTVKSLEERGFVRDGKVAQAGIDAMEPYRVKRAVFIAAGFGTRLVPITLNTPKPLVRVHGKRIIDT